MTETTNVVKKETRTSLFTPNFEPIEYGSPVDMHIVAQEPAFEIEKQYSFDTSSYAKEHDDQSVMEMPTLERQTIVASEQKTEVYARPRLNARAKIMISCYSVIVAIMIAFAIYSGVMISSYSADIASKNQIVASQVAVINSLEQTYDSLGENEAIEVSLPDGFVSPDSSNIKHIDGFEMQERTEIEVESNWFEKFCEKLKKLFS